MRYLLGSLLGCLLLAGQPLYAQDRAMPASLIQLIGNPEKFDKKVVDVIAFLVIEREPRHPPMAWVSLYQEDAKNLLGNSILVIPSEQMLRDEEKINDIYVRLRGTFRATPTEGGGLSLEIKDVQNCVPWSNPSRPLGVKQNQTNMK